MVKREDPRKKQIAVYIFTVLFSVAYILIAGQIARDGYPDWPAPEDDTYVARVMDTVSVEDGENGDREIFFHGKVISGPEKGAVVTIRQTIDASNFSYQHEVERGDKVLFYEDRYNDDSDWLMLEYYRTNIMILLGAVFALGLLVFGRFKGFNALVALVFTCLSVFLVFIPSVFSGHNIYLWSIITCLYMIVMTMLLINGASKKSFCAGVGCFSGVALAGVLTAVLNHFMKLTGMVNDDTLYLKLLDLPNPIDLNGIVFAAIIIGAVGAIMDVAMDIASSLYEMQQNQPEITAKQMVRSGFNIGRDVMGTMANTLVLAYIGSSLCTTLLFVAYNVSSIQLFNMELIVTDFMQAIVGSIGILLAIPLTSFICAVVYPKH